MKIAISASDNQLDAAVDARFGRAPWFIIVDTETEEWRGVPNTQNLNAVQGAGIQAAQCVAEQGVKAVLTGHCGPKAFRALTAAGIGIFVDVAGHVNDAVARFKNDEFTESSAADVNGHWA